MKNEIELKETNLNVDVLNADTVRAKAVSLYDENGNIITLTYEGLKKLLDK